ncbi:tetratricopeptide repeat protein [Coralloluteibacterium stylophorae]|uniref:Tetratricopeptide repeat protein n=1 Tax=Coralloluteibacterium stylophorae TaxID=1776034 RepID=A0A8J8AX23_9GAMM|nr:tetratricopeptide repeat protein [Coralloluteibacterium stylophorae]MBS7458953.1 tetratricopeptide repeat protein [Coralloluteibacterium stylophorae]
MHTSKLMQSIAIALALASGYAAIAPAHAQRGSGSDRLEERRREREERRSTREQDGDEQQALFPDATREEPDAKASARISRKLEELQQLSEDGMTEEAAALGDEVASDSKANAYERAFAMQAVGSAYLNAGDYPAALPYLQRAVEADGLPNDVHYQVLYQIAQLQLQEGNYAESLAAIDRLITETRSTKPEYAVTKGNALYRLERYPEAIAALEPAVKGSPSPDPSWVQLLMGSYAEAGQADAAARLGEELAQNNGGDVQSQLNLAVIYQQAGQTEKAAQTLEALRASGQLTEARQYRQLYALYSQLEGREASTIEVINDGLDKGILTPNAEVYAMLGQAYYYSDQPEQAIEAFRQGAPLADDGELYLNLARLLSGEGRASEAADAARQALQKGVRDPADANRIIGSAK